MIDRATEAGYCATNPLRLALCQKNASNRFFAQVRHSLAKKHFTADELRKAYCYLRTKLEQGHHQYLGVLIRLLTGLESSIICALRWEDFHYSPEYHLHYFIITRQIDSNNMVKGFRNVEDYICFPLASQLSSTLTKYISPATISQRSSCIVNDVLPNNCINKAITPKVLNTLVKEMISAVGIDPRIVTLPDQDGNFRETDLNKYHGDFLRENFRHWAGQFCNLNADEMDYLLRRKATTTLGHYYCDFLNEASQLIIQVKLNRLESITNPKTTAFKKHYLVLDATHICNIAANPSARTSASIELTTSGNSNIALHFESPYGYSYEVTPIISEEDKA